MLLLSAAILGIASVAGAAVVLISKHDEPAAGEQTRGRYFYRISGFAFAKEPASVPWRSWRWQVGFALLMYGAVAALALIIIWSFQHAGW